MTGHQCTEIEHYLFRDANSFSGAKLEESCELRGTDYFQGQKYEYIFQRKMEATVTTNSLPCTVGRVECCVSGQSHARKNNRWIMMSVM